MIEDKPTYTKEEMIEIVRQVLFTGDPDYYDQGGITKTINIPPNYTTVRAMMAIEKYAFKRASKK